MKPRNFFAELIPARQQPDFRANYLLTSVRRDSNAFKRSVQADVIDGCRDVLTETSRKHCLLKKFLGC